MASLIKETNEYEHQYGQNQVETVVHIQMSKANAAKFQKRLDAVENCQDDLYAAYAVEDKTVKFANGFTGSLLDDAIIADLIGTINGKFEWVGSRNLWK